MPVDPQSLDGVWVGTHSDSTGTTKPVVVPDSILQKHMLISGQTGSGKSVTATQGIRSVDASTDGATIVIDPKGDGWPTMIGRARYADRCLMGSHSPATAFEDVLYFDAGVGLPQLPLFDLRPALTAGMRRIDAARTVVDDTLAVLEYLHPGSDDAVRSPDVIQTLLLALFDPEFGSDAVTLSELYNAANRLQEERAVPRVSPEWLQHLLTNTTTGSQRLFAAVQQGVQTRLSKLYQDPYLRAMFDTVPDEAAFELSDWLDEDVLIIIDISDLSDQAQRVVAHVILTRLWRALHWRQAEIAAADTPPLVSLWIDEVPHLQIHDPLSELLSMGRGLGLSVVSMMQFPRQLKQESGDRAYDEVLSNVGTLLCGTHHHASQLASRLATTNRSAAEFETLLSDLPSDRWLFSPAGGRTLRTRQPPRMVINDPPLPPGHPAGQAPLPPQAAQRFSQVWRDCRQSTVDQYGVVPSGYEATTDTPVADGTLKRGLTHTLWQDHIDLPAGVTYDAVDDTIQCTDCGAAFLPQFEKLQVALQHCETPDVDDSALPVTDIGLATVTPAQLDTSPISLHEAMFLRLVERAERREIDDREWDVTTESMLPLRDAAGLDADDTADLADAGYLNQQSDYRGAYWRLTNTGKQMLSTIRDGGDPPGTKPGDPAESVAHIRLVETAAAVLERLAADPTSPLATVQRYWTVPDTNSVVDLVAFDEAGVARIVVEAERTTNDLKRAAPADYDVMAQVDSAAALWVVPGRTDGHKLIRALADPLDGEPRLSFATGDLYADTTPLDRYELDTSGCSGVHTVRTFDEDVVQEVL